MALSANTIAEVQTGASDTDNSGGFNPQNGSMATDLACDTGTSNTNAPVVSSASYNFQARDVGHWVFIQAGGTYLPGWYKISSVASNKATLDATIGHAVLYASGYTVGLNTATGCKSDNSTTANGTWSIDYSQTTSVGVAFTDLVAATTTTFTSAAKPIGKNFVGNIVVITSGTGWNAARWEVSSVSGTTGTAANFSTGTTIATASSTGGTGGLGGALATPAQAYTTYVSALAVHFKGGTTYNLTGTMFAWSTRRLAGYTTTRDDGGYAKFDASGMTAANDTFQNLTDHGYWYNLQIDNSKRDAFSASGNHNTYRCIATLAGRTGFAGPKATRCAAISCAGTGFTGPAACCVAIHNNRGFEATATNCIASHNTLEGFGNANENVFWENNIAYKNGASGFYGARSNHLVNNISYGNLTYGISLISTGNFLHNNAVGVNTSGPFNGNSGAGFASGTITLTADPFIDADNATISLRNFGLNTTAGGGALLRGLGFPGLFEYLTTTLGYLDVGAVQHQDAGGGGTTNIITTRRLVR